MITQGECPSCRAPVEFTVAGAPVVICGFCNTVVGRSDVAFEDRGKVATLFDTGSQLKLGLWGMYEGRRFQLVGRVQKDWGRGVWDEWHAVFEDEKSAWLADGEGGWYVLVRTIDLDLPEVPPQPAQVVSAAGRRFVVEETRAAKIVSAQGQLPAGVNFGGEGVASDMTDAGGGFATIDYSGEVPELFVGQQIKFNALGFERSELEERTRNVALLGARCPQCNGMLDLKAPDLALRVVCPYCSGLSSVENGNLAFMRMLEKPDHEPLIPLGARGTLKEVPYTCLAFLIRSCIVDGTRYSWDEYLLWNRAEGFRWLMQSEGHWTFLTPIPAGTLTVRRSSVRYRGETYQGFQRVTACTDYILGECYWKVMVGETAIAAEWIAPPLSINEDFTDEEVTYTFGEYLEPAEVQAAFDLRQALPPKRGIAPSQPAKKGTGENVWAWAGLYAVVLLGLQMFFLIMRPAEVLMQTDISPRPGVASGTAEAMAFSEPFEISRGEPVGFEVSVAGLSNSWAALEFDLVNEATGAVVSAMTETSYYEGYEDGERWSEGSTRDSELVTAVPPGRYSVRLVPYFDKPPSAFHVKVTQGHARPGWLLFTLLLVLGPALALSGRSLHMESKRWENENWSER